MALGSLTLKQAKDTTKSALRSQNNKIRIFRKARISIFTVHWMASTAPFKIRFPIYLFTEQ